MTTLNPLRPLFCILGILSMISCSEDLDILTGSESIPVVYCIINPQDSVFNVLLTRTFSGYKSAPEMAQDPAFIAYQRAKITLEAWSKGFRIWETVFSAMPYGRDTGFFSSAPGCAFETRNVLSSFFGYSSLENPDTLFDDLRLVIDYQDNHEPSYARIAANIAKPKIIYPIYTYKEFRLYDSIPYYIEFNTSDRLYYDLRCKIHYREEANSIEDKTIDFSVHPDIDTKDGPQFLFINPDKFFKRLAKAFPDSKDVIQRDLISLDLELHVGSSSLRTFMDTYYSDNDQGYQLWNNFHNGIGLFALKAYTSLSKLVMDQRTKDSLAWGRYTKDLKFNRW
ncbi:MAG: DUF4249 family protein [Porphyromonadaceae bacterium]|nr:MAG: DUF4249 family protein [Porphyromonadaceae bacterium]